MLFMELYPFVAYVLNRMSVQLYGIPIAGVIYLEYNFTEIQKHSIAIVCVLN